MISRVDGCATHTPINSKIKELISDRDKEIVGNAQMSSDCRPLAPPDDGYQADDEFDPHDDLADSIFGDSSPTVYFVSVPPQKVDADGRRRQIPCLSPTQCSLTPSILAKSHSPSDNGDESHYSRLISYTGHSQDDSDVQTSSLSDSLPSERSETLSEDNSSSVSLPEETPAQRGGIPRVPETGHEGERHDGDIIALRETARAISGALVDLEVLDDFYRLDGDEFGDDLVEVKPRALSVCPALVAYRDGSGQITVPLEMRCNQRAASIIADLAAKFDIPPTANAVAGTPRSCHSNGQCDLDVFPPPPWQASDFESSDEELKELFSESPARGRKRCHDDIEEGDDEENETGVKTHLCSPQKRRRL